MLYGPLLALLAAAAHGAASDYPLPKPLPASTDTTHMDYAADHVDYDESSDTLHLQGNVVVWQDSWTIKARELWINTETWQGRSEGDLLLDNGPSAIYGDRGVFDFRRRAGTLFNSRAGHQEWSIHGRSSRVDPSQRLYYKRADFTGCEFHPPHYHLYATHVKIVPHKYIWAWNTVYFLGPVPVFYTPFFYKSLRPKGLLDLKLRPGKDKRNGFFLKGTILSELGPHAYSKTYLDYYENQGFGHGLELHRRKGQDERAAIYGYRIQDSSGTRWTIQGDAYQSIVGGLAAQARLQSQSDPHFNNHYDRNSYFRITPELINNAALVYNMSWVSNRVSWERRDLVDENRPEQERRYVKVSETIPRYDFNTAQFNFGLPWLNSFSGFAQSNYTQGRNFLERTAAVNWAGTRNFRLHRTLTYVPTLNYQQNYVNRQVIANRNVFDTWVGRYTVTNGLRFVSLIGDWDATHVYVKRLRPDAIDEDLEPPDRGVESNIVTLQDTIRPNRRTLFRTSSAYDLRAPRGGPNQTFRTRLQPIVAEVELTPHYLFALSARQDYQLGEGSRSFLFDTRVGDEEGTFIRVGGGNNFASKSLYLFNSDIGWRSKDRRTRVLAGLRGQANTPSHVLRLSRLYLFEKEFTISRRWHDFYTWFMARYRPDNVQEYSVRLDLRLGKSEPRVPRKDWEAEWFPHRSLPTADRP
ncbi:MAG: LPS-assembly protein LptD [Elusimicrobia bacterium]|nr:LPS-assembly protein LptD [Elusimicrobiota bacterium]